MGKVSSGWAWIAFHGPRREKVYSKGEFILSNQHWQGFRGVWLGIADCSRRLGCRCESETVRSASGSRHFYQSRVEGRSVADVRQPFTGQHIDILAARA